MPDCYLITGGSGNLAGQLTSRLEDPDKQVVLFDINPPRFDLRGNCEFVEGDIARTEDLEAVFRKFRPTVVLHMASLLSGSSERDHRLAWQINATASFELLELATKYRVKCFFFPSTAVTCGPGLEDPLPEEFPQWPENLYGVTKVAVERAGNYFFARHGLNFRSVRLPFVVSRFAPKGALTAYASHVFVEAVSKNKFVFPVHPDSVVSTIYVNDVIHGMLKFIQAPEEPLTRRVYNLHGFSPPAESIGEAIKTRLPGFEYSFDPLPDVLKVIDAMPGDMDDSAARKEWGWDPQFDLDKMAEDFLIELKAAQKL